MVRGIGHREVNAMLARRAGRDVKSGLSQVLALPQAPERRGRVERGREVTPEHIETLPRRLPTRVLGCAGLLLLGAACSTDTPRSAADPLRPSLEHDEV